MAISPNAKRARNTSENEEKAMSKRKKHAEVTTEAVSSPIKSQSKKARLSKAGTPKNEAPGKHDKAMKSKLVGSEKKKGEVANIMKGKSDKKAGKAVSKKANVGGKSTKGKITMEVEDESDEDESEEQESEEAEESEEVEESEEGDSDEVNKNEDSDDEKADDADEDAVEDAGSDEDEGEEGDEESDDEDESEEEDDGEDKHSKPQSDGRGRGNELTLFVTNVPYSAEKDDLKKFFGIAGAVKDVRIPVNNKTGRPRGFAFVSMEDEEGINAALKLDNEEMEGRPLRVQKSMEGSGGGGGRFQRGGGGRWRGGDSRGFRGGRGFSGERSGRGGGGYGERSGRGGGYGGDRGGRGFGSSRGFGGDRGGRGFGRGGGRGFKGGDRDRRGGFGRPFQRGGGRPWQNRDGPSKDSRQSGGDSD